MNSFKVFVSALAPTTFKIASSAENFRKLPIATVSLLIINYVSISVCAAVRNISPIRRYRIDKRPNNWRFETRVRTSSSKYDEYFLLIYFTRVGASDSKRGGSGYLTIASRAPFHTRSSRFDPRCGHSRKALQAGDIRLMAASKVALSDIRYTCKPIMVLYDRARPSTI